MIESVMISLDDLRVGVVRLGALTAGAINAGTDALVRADTDAAEVVIADDDAIDALRHSLEDDCLALLAARPLAPAGVRFVASTTRVTYELERSGDLMVNVAKATIRLAPYAPDATSCAIVEELGRRVVVQLRVAVNAFVDLDASGAAAVEDMDNSVDDLHRSLLRHLVEGGEPDADPDAHFARAVQLTLVGHHYERIGDHAVNIAELVYLAEGRRRSRPPRRRARELAPG